MQKLKLDLLKFAGAKQFTSREGIDFIAIPIVGNNIFVGKTTLSLDLTLIENRDGKDRFENDGFASLDVGKERRLAGEKGPIVGNWKHLESKAKVNLTPPAKRPPVKPKDADLDIEPDGESIPF